MRRKFAYLLLGLVATTAVGCLCADEASAKYAESKSLSLTINIEKHYEVEFRANGGIGSMANQQFTAGVSQALTANAFTQEGYHFIGWNRVATGGMEGDFYENQEMISTDLTNIGGGTVVLYAQWEKNAMKTVFEITGACIFHGYDIQQNTGDGYITGTDCTSNGTNWADGSHKYIDSDIKLYDTTNYEKDYEIGFIIQSYDQAHQYIEPGDSASQATFMNSKYENEDRHWPGIVIRKSAEKIEITQTIKKGNTHEKKTGSKASADGMKVVITRVDGVVYYSFNDGPFTVLQDMNGTSDYFDVDVWFGASEKSDGTPMRYIDAALSDIYIKVGEKGSNKHVVSFDAGGVVADPDDVTVISTRTIGNNLPSMPEYEDTEEGRLYFIGWYTGADGTGEKVTEDTVIDRDVALYAFWNDEKIVCSAAGETDDTLQDCVNKAGAGDTVTLLDNIREQITVANGKEIILDLNGHKLSDNSVAGKPVIENFGKLTVINGTITSTLRAGVLNNNSTGEMYIGSDARIIATGIRQAIYNNGGRLEISGNAYLSAVSSERATVHNLAGGSLVIKGGTIIATKQEAVKVDSGSLVIGTEDGTAHNDTPVIQGATYGVTTSVNITMYDGVLRGKTAAINDTTKIAEWEDGATAVGIDSVVTETIDGVVYEVIYYQ